MAGAREVTLNNGVVMPMLGLGTYRSGPGKEAERAVAWALEAGYRLIDTSLAYWNERDVGKAIRKSGVPRRELFITTKLENDDHGYDSTLDACEISLENLGTDYLDLYLIHWPVPRLRLQTWRAMERLLEEGKCRAIGVSNYTERHLRELFEHADVIPAVNQVEFHPFLFQNELLQFCHKNKIRLEAYSPLVKATRFDHPLLVELAADYDKTPAQILLRWNIQHDVIAIPKSVHRDWIRENIDICGFSITQKDMHRLDALNENRHTDWDPTHVN